MRKMPIDLLKILLMLSCVCCTFAATEMLPVANAEVETAEMPPSQLLATIPLTDWKFQLISNVADESYDSTAEAATSYDDAAWRNVTVPHDWSIELDFNPDSLAGYEGAYLDGGDAWYRTTVEIHKQDDQRYLLNFDGVYMESTVYINGHEAHRNYYGYNPFTIDATDLLINGKNVIAVFVRNQQPSSRWYSGSGLIRPVKLTVYQDDLLRMENIRVKTVQLSDDYALSTVTFDVTSQLDHIDYGLFKVFVYGASGEAEVETMPELRQIADGKTLSRTTQLQITFQHSKPLLWSIGQGNLYTLQIRAEMDDRVQYSEPIRFGYRTIQFSNVSGFSLNGEPVKLKGVCLHHDGGCIGAAENRSAIERQIDILISMGCNAIRLTHNPFGAVFLDVCQEKGILVIEEFFDCWSHPKNEYDFARYFDDHYREVVMNTIRRDWNNPAIIMWSLGNEVWTTLPDQGYTTAEISQKCRQLNRLVKSLDTSRPTTLGNDHPGDFLSNLMGIVDVIGINYNDNTQSYQAMQPIYGSETTSALASRGEYVRSGSRMVYSSYDDNVVLWGNSAAGTVNAYLSSERSCGHFVWTGFDYLGEPTEWNRYPSKSSYFGIVDTCGFPKDIYYMYQSMWTDEPMIHILPHWTHEGGSINVWLYANCASVELLLNGESLGVRTLAERGSHNEFAFDVPYVPGTLVANGYDQAGHLIAQDIQRTSGTPYALSLSSDKATVQAGSSDLIYITCDIVDQEGTLCPTASNKVTFSITGGTILGTDCGHGACVERLQGTEHHAFNGKCLCVVKADENAGEIVVTATADGLTVGIIRVQKTPDA